MIIYEGSKLTKKTNLAILDHFKNIDDKPYKLQGLGGGINHPLQFFQCFFY